jgi:hypothetical protein
VEKDTAISQLGKRCEMRQRKSERERERESESDKRFLMLVFA